MMNNDLVDDASRRFAERLKNKTGEDLAGAVTLGFRTALCRHPSDAEQSRALDYLRGDAGRLEGLAWLLLNMDEFLYVR